MVNSTKQQESIVIRPHHLEGVLHSVIACISTPKYAKIAEVMEPQEALAMTYAAEDLLTDSTQEEIKKEITERFKDDDRFKKIVGFLQNMQKKNPDADSLVPKSDMYRTLKNAYDKNTDSTVVFQNVYDHFCKTCSFHADRNDGKPCMASIRSSRGELEMDDTVMRVQGKWEYDKPYKIREVLDWLLAQGTRRKIAMISVWQHDKPEERTKWEADVAKGEKRSAKEKLESPEFDEMFNENISTVECPESGTVRKLDISPKNPKDVIFLSPGWLETLESNKYYIKSLYEYGYRIISLQHPRKGGKSKNPKERRLSALKSVLDSTDTPRMQVLGHSLGVVDIVEYADPDLNPDVHKRFKNFIFTNPCGLTAKKYGRQLLRLAKNYALNHMGQKKDADKHIEKLIDERKPLKQLEGSGIPMTEIATEIRNEMDTRGGEEFGSNLALSAKEGVRVATSHIQDNLRKLRKQGHSIYIFSSLDDRLVPRNDYALKVSNSSPDGEDFKKDDDFKSVKGIKYVNDDKADVDKVIALAGYHNTPRNIDFRDYDNPQTITHVWIDALLRDLKAKET